KMNRKSFLTFSLIFGLLTQSTGLLSDEHDADGHKNTSSKAGKDSVRSLIIKKSDKTLPPLRIITKKKEHVVEYRMNGAVIMIKIIPSKGAPYYLVDSNGDGNLNVRQPNMNPEFLIPQWTLFRW
ncbi:MAG: DUF2782 domain-containing protein, partial [Gammaproteobacteria bacterium]